jgi:hypothetical protein
MRIAQRGSSVSIPTGTAAYGSCDRWKLTNTAGGTLTSEQVSLLDENGISRQFSRTTIAVVSTGISGVSQVQPFAQTLEGFNCFDLLGKQVTISFTLRASIAGTYAVSLYDSTGAASCVKSVVVSASNTPQRFAVTFPAIPSSAVIPAAATAGLNFAIGGLNTGTYQAPSLNTWVAGTYISAAGMTNWTATLNATLAVTDVQLEAGSVATPFERRSYGQELELCQRYYETGTVRVWGYADAGSGFGTTQPFKVSKRAAPTVAAVNSSAGNVSAAYAVLTGDTTGIVITHNATALGALAYVDTWTASAEL